MQPSANAYSGPARRVAPIRRITFPAWLAFACSVAAVPAEAVPVQTLARQPSYLRSGPTAQWEQFDHMTPHGSWLELPLHVEHTAAGGTLLVRQEHVKHPWEVLVNGRRVGMLPRIGEALVSTFELPPEFVRTGRNLVAIRPRNQGDDVIIHEVSFAPAPPREVLGQSHLEITVVEAGAGEQASRVTLVDEHGALAPLDVEPSDSIAWRTGVVYTATGRARIGLLPGRYTVYAGRGFEYSVARAEVTIAPGAVERLELQISREVPTPGMVAADSHIHTLTFSRHGDATLAERLVTIAGEGIELAIATDHNHYADYSEASDTLGLSERFTSVVGNEVTTAVGHFNMFPAHPAAALPDHTLKEWPALLRSIRASGATVITLNHPRDLHGSFRPLGPEHFDATVGRFRNVPDLDCDALEVVTSGALQSDILHLYRDWFALLNGGHRIAAIGSSDTHDVSRMIVGQGRTYVACDDATPGQLDLDQICASYKAGRLWVSLGLLTHVTVNGTAGVGDLAACPDDQVEVEVEVLGPSWTTADRVELYLNGVLSRTELVRPTRTVSKTKIRWSLERPSHDVHLVVIAKGPGVEAPYWPLPRPYQPTSRRHEPRLVGSTGAVWLDADRDGTFSPARMYAAGVVERNARSLSAVLAELAHYDEPVAIQAAALCAEAGLLPGGPELEAALERAADQVRLGFRRYLSTPNPLASGR